MQVKFQLGTPRAPLCCYYYSLGASCRYFTAIRFYFKPRELVDITISIMQFWRNGGGGPDDAIHRNIRRLASGARGDAIKDFRM